MLQLSETQHQIVSEIISGVVQAPYEVFAYGSRTKGEARPYSDLDLLIKAEEKLPLKTLYQLKDQFEFSDLNFRVDIQDWFNISTEFLSQIEDSLIQL